MNDEIQTQMENLLRETIPDPEKGLDKEHVQKLLTRKFTAALLLRGEQSPDEVTLNFGKLWSGMLSWLGEGRQDDILRAAMEEAHVDLSHWLGEE